MFQSIKSDTEILCRAAIPLNVSPLLTVYVDFPLFELELLLDEELDELLDLDVSIT
ncbi:hypothetical protein GCM10007063_16890 [Lentibacillus kapialis]|uniref:Uncharacterized protein n=1 Tax=Lentibacillus kapialis TaxID=340214 RepID=A0A917PWC7_9BACI|nr:hypothetical protein GCM10007063_16890 [Lentibacillus kapialis]